MKPTFMMTRKERRAAAHAARKAERKAGSVNNNNPTTKADPAIPKIDPYLDAMFNHPGPCEPENGIFCGDPDCIPCKTWSDNDDFDSPVTAHTTPPGTPKPPLSEARLEANRKSAQASTGPKTSAGKAKVAQNAVKTALTGRTVLLPFDDVDAYQQLLDDYVEEFQPVGVIERGLVQSLVDTCWRLERIPGLEYALIENGYNQLGTEDAARTLATPNATLEMQIRLCAEKDFRNLALQESRLVRRREREMKELRELQATRKAKEEEQLKQAAQLSLVAGAKKQPFNLEELGFVFSTARFAQYMARLTPAMKNNLLREAVSLMPQSQSAAA